MKKFLSVLIAFVMLISFPVHANATENVNADYVRFIPYNTRITSGGAFNFEYEDNMTSESFWPISSQITIEASATLVHRDTGTVRKDNGVTYRIYIVNANTGVSAGYLEASANGKEATGTFTVSTGVEYHLEFTVSGSIREFERVTGSGDLSNIRVNHQ